MRGEREARALPPPLSSTAKLILRAKSRCMSLWMAPAAPAPAAPPAADMPPVARPPRPPWERVAVEAGKGPCGRRERDGSPPAKTCDASDCMLRRLAISPSTSGVT